MSTNQPKDTATWKDALFLYAALRADVAALLQVQTKLLTTLSVPQIEGLPPLEWLEQQRRVELERVLAQLENVSPTVAAELLRRFGYDPESPQ